MGLRVAAVVVAEIVAVVVLLLGAAGPADAVEAGRIHTVLDNIISLLQSVLVALAVLLLVVAGIRLLTAVDPAQASKGKVQILLAFVGFAIAGLAPDLVAILQSVLGTRFS